MKLSKISITNLAGLASFEATLPSVCLLEGKHGAGKSSLQRCLMYSFGLRPLAEKGQKAIMHDPSILHGTSEKGECLLSFEDGPLESLRVRVTPDKTERTIKVRGKKAWELAGQQIYDITNALSYNPLQFRDLNPKERLEAFLKVVPVEIDALEIATAVGGVLPLNNVTPSLESINAIYDDIFKARTTENSAVDTQTKYAAQLEAALGPVAPGENWDAEVARLRSDKATLDASEQAEIQRIGRELAAAKEVASAKHRTQHAAIDSDINQKVDGIQSQIRELQVQLSVLEGERKSRKSEDERVESEWVLALRNNANSEVSEIRTANAPLHAKLTADIATAEERARKSAQDEGTRAAAVEARKQADEHATQSKAMTEALDRLKALKAEVAGRMSIRGYTIASPREGFPVDLCREENGALVPFEVWNDADKDALCLRLAVLYRGPCGLVMVDNTGNWSPARKSQIIEKCKKLAATDGMQFLLGTATDDGELRIVDAGSAA